MTDEERRIIQSFMERISGVAQAAPSRSPWGASVPQVGQAPNLPPVDPEADRFIADLFTRLPEARYRLTQSAFVQEAALVEANNRIQQLEWEVENARRQGQQAQQPRGMFGGMFGGGGRQQQAPMPPPPQPQYPPGYNPQVLQQGRGGMGFLGTAVAGAAGVAGGLVLGNMLMNSLGGHGAGAAQAAAATPGQGAFGQEAVPSSPADSSPWNTPDAAPVADQGGWGSGGGQADNFGSGSQDDASADYGSSSSGGGDDEY
jgi:hypothetical protein